MREVIKKEMRGLAERRKFETVCKEEVLKQDERPNIMGGRFVLAIKNVGTGEEV